MHLAEGVLPLSQAIAWSALAGPTVFWSLREEQRTRRNTPSSSVIMAGATSLLFAGTLLPLPVPVVGATSHICLTPVLAVALSDVTAPATTFGAVLLGFAPVQIPLEVLEAVASVGIVRLLATRRPDLLPNSLSARKSFSI